MFVEALQLNSGAASKHSVAGSAELLHGGPLGRVTGEKHGHCALEDTQLPPVDRSEPDAFPGQLQAILALDAVHHLHKPLHDQE